MLSKSNHVSASTSAFTSPPRIRLTDLLSLSKKARDPSMPSFSPRATTENPSAPSDQRKKQKALSLSLSLSLTLWWRTGSRKMFARSSDLNRLAAAVESEREEKVASSREREKDNRVREREHKSSLSPSLSVLVEKREKREQGERERERESARPLTPMCTHTCTRTCARI